MHKGLAVKLAFLLYRVSLQYQVMWVKRPEVSASSLSYREQNT